MSGVDEGKAMRKMSLAIGAGAALVVAMLGTGVAAADDAATPAKPPAMGSTKPDMGKGPAVEKSLPSSAPAATTKQTTGATDQNKTVKSMNSNEKDKVEATGK
jgi:hypothetical protein